MAGFLVHIGDSIIYTSINEDNISEIFVVAYPNPATDLFYLDFKTPVKNAFVEITGLDGHRIKGEMFKNISGAQKFDVRELPKGMYLLRITVDGATVTRKVLIR
jgi:hypothetical protein